MEIVAWRDGGAGHSFTEHQKRRQDGAKHFSNKIDVRPKGYQYYIFKSEYLPTKP
jgi:hypothetical protein